MTIQAALGKGAAPHGSPRFRRGDGTGSGARRKSAGEVLQRRGAAGRRGCVALVGVCLVLAFCPTAGAAPRGGPGHIRPRSFLFDPFFDQDFYGPVIPELPPPSGYPPIFNFPEDNGTDVYEATPRSQGVPFPYPQGFSLNVPTATDDGTATPAADKAKLNTYRAIADALGRCWRPPPTFAGQRWNTITLRVSFKRDGMVNGLPRIPYADPGLTADARSGLNRSLTAALQRCTPLDLTPGLGSAIAGQIFALRFIEQSPQGAAHVGQPQDPDARNHARPGGDPPAP